MDEEYNEYQRIHKDGILKEKIKGLKKYTESIKGKSKKEILGDEKYEDFLKSMEGVFTLEWFISKYGEHDGNMRYQERSLNLSKTSHFKIYNKTNKNNWSNISQELFKSIYDILGERFNKIYFAELNHEYSCGVKGHNFDFVILDNKKVIEFNGDKFHANPELYNENDVPLKSLKKTSKEIWLHDKIKNTKAIDNGFDLLVVWEKDYLDDKDKVLLECLKFLL